MSELKGQILAIILVLGIFAAISQPLKNAFTSLTNNVSAEVSEITKSSIA